MRILFLCTGNSCRSQMAEGWARKLKSDRFEAYSAGVKPVGMNRDAIKVMAEAGVDISGHTSKHVDYLADIAFDYVVTVCDDAPKSCPLFPGSAKIVHRSFDDPPRFIHGAQNEEERLAPYRRVRDEIREFIMALPESLTVDASAMHP